MVRSQQGGPGDDHEERHSNEFEPGHQTSVSDIKRASLKTKLTLYTGDVTRKLLRPGPRGADQEGESPSYSRPRTPTVTAVSPSGETRIIHRDDDTQSGAGSFGGHSPGSFYSQPATGSEQSFASIETVTDLGFDRHGDTSKATDTTAWQPQDLCSLHPGQALRNRSGSSASAIHFSEGKDKTSQMAQKLAERLKSSYRKGKDNAAFCPISDIQRILTTANVQQVLKEIFPELSGEELNQLTQDICDQPPGMPIESQLRRPSRKRLFAILLRGDKPRCIRCFVECRVTDSDLPLQPNAEEDLTFYRRSDIELRNPLKCFEKWTTVHREWFARCQFEVLAPFFDLDPNNVCFYPLDASIVLPFIEFEEIVEGGQASVSKVLVHRAHHNLRVEDGTGNPYFAVKRLHSHNRDGYKKEVEVLERFSGKNVGHSHLIRLLLTYQHGDNFHLLFRWADGNLSDFWQSNPSPKRSKRLACWMVTQCHGIADGLRAIHGDIRNGELTPDDKNTGRHGDLKPENILWFKHYNGSDNHLLISDFGLSCFHRFKSQSEEKAPGFSPTYRPPECELTGITISVKYDIWTLGCLLLDFLSWYLRGFEAVVGTFTDWRLEDEGWSPRQEPRIDNTKEFYEDKFFKLYRDGTRLMARLKHSVVRWMTSLHELECPEFAHDILQVIQEGLLVPDKRLRWHCSQIVDKLSEICQKCDKSEAYCLTPQKWKGKVVEPLPVPHLYYQFEPMDCVVTSSGEPREGRSRDGSPSNEQRSPTPTRPSRRRRAQSTPPQRSPRQSLSREREENQSTPHPLLQPPPLIHQNTLPARPRPDHAPPTPDQVVHVSNTHISPPAQEQSPPIPDIPAASTPPPTALFTARTGSGPPGRSTITIGTQKTNSGAPLLGAPAQPRAGKAQRIWEGCKRCAKGIGSCFRFPSGEDC